MKLTKTDLQSHRTVASHVIVVLFIAAIGFALPGRAFATGDFTVTVTASANPTTIYTGQNATGSASASIMGNNAGAQQEITQYNPSASFSVSVKGTHANDTPPSASINSSSGANLTVTAGSGTTADTYAVTVTATYSWTETGNVPYSASGSATISITVVAITASFSSQPPTRIPISGSIDNSKTISITISPSPLPAGVGPIGVSVVGGGASVSPSSLQASGKVVLKGSANSSIANSLTIQLTSGNTVLATSSAFTVSTWPTGGTINTLSKNDGYGMTTHITWASESGSVSDLGNCQVLEQITPGSAPNPPFTATSVRVQGDWVAFSNNNSDTHDYGKGAVDCSTGATGNYSTAQAYNFRDVVLHTSPTSILNDTINRSVSADPPYVVSNSHYVFTTTITGGGYSDQSIEYP